MGKVVLVPPTIEFDKLVAPYGGRYTGLNRTYPATVTNSLPTLGDDYVTKTELSTLLVTTVSVSIPEPNTDIFREDALQHFVNYYNLGRLRHSKRPRTTGSWMGWDLRADQIAHTFWDFQEIEELTSTLKGDLLLQPGEEKWKFHGTHPDDAGIIPQLFFRAKKYQFKIRALGSDLKEELHNWLDKHVTEYDFEPNMNPTIYIRNETEAAHFKLKWVGENIFGPLGS